MAYASKEDQAAAARRHYDANKQKMVDRAAAHMKQLRAEIRASLQELKSTTPCMDCGVTYPYYVMQFDHVRGEKLFDIANTPKWTSWKRVLDEVAKCELVCGNCHAARTHFRSQAVAAVQ